MPFDEYNFDRERPNYTRTPNLDAPNLAAGRSMTPAARHALCMMYLEKTACDGITPEELVLEYFLAETRIEDFMRASNDRAAQKNATPKGGVQGHTLKDSIPHSPQS